MLLAFDAMDPQRSNNGMVSEGFENVKKRNPADQRFCALPAGFVLAPKRDIALELYTVVNRTRNRKSYLMPS